MVDAIASLNSGAATAPIMAPQASVVLPAEPKEAPAEKQSPAKELSTKEIRSIVKELNKALETLSTKVTFSVDEKSRKPIIKIIDADSKQVIFQMPPEGMLRAAQRMTQLLGMIVDHTN